MSKTLGERMEKLEADMQYLKDSNNEIKVSLKEFIDKADNKYASKLTERLVYGMLVAIGIATITWLVRFIITGSFK